MPSYSSLLDHGLFQVISNILIGKRGKKMDGPLDWNMTKLIVWSGLWSRDWG